LRSIKEVIQIAIFEENQELVHLSFSIIHFDIVRLYLEYFPELLNCKSTSNGNTLINKAAHIGNLEIMKYLVSKGSNISIPNDVGNRPIHRAAYCGHAEIVKYLVEDCGERVDVFQHSTPKSKRLETSLHLAARKGYMECVKILLTNGSDVTLQTKSETPTARRDAMQLSKRYNQLVVFDFLRKVFQQTTRSC
jgi:ankyrin repeat protein